MEIPLLGILKSILWVFHRYIYLLLEAAIAPLDQARFIAYLTFAPVRNSGAEDSLTRTAITEKRLELILSTTPRAALIDIVKKGNTEFHEFR